jgi:uncharacterized membrane protein
MTLQTPSPQTSVTPGISHQPAQRIHPMDQHPAPVICPACGGENAHDAIFCANPSCHKALGELRYVLEEMRKEAQWHESLAEKAVAFIGKPHFIIFHCLWFGIWALLNSGLIPFVRTFDAFPFFLLGIILAAEAIFIAGFVLISNNRQTAHDNKRAELDYEVNVRTYRSISQLDALMKATIDRLNQLEGR